MKNRWILCLFYQHTQDHNFFHFVLMNKRVWTTSFESYFKIIFTWSCFGDKDQVLLLRWVISFLDVALIECQPLSLLCTELNQLSITLCISFKYLIQDDHFISLHVPIPSTLSRLTNWVRIYHFSQNCVIIVFDLKDWWQRKFYIWRGSNNVLLQ